jgi:enoyl-CoA hydratase/carnithine racemase
MIGRPPEGDWLGTPFVRFERHGTLGYAIVDRPEARNAMTGAMYFAIRYAVNLVDQDPTLAGLLITGTGDVFIPGGDMSGENVDGWIDLPRLLGWDTTPFDALRCARKPVVSALNGITQGGGLMIAMLSDVAVAAESATFRAPELLRGLPDTFYAQILPRQIGPARARDMLLTGRVVSSAEAGAWGLVSRVVADSDLMNAAHEALVQCCRSAPQARTAVKQTLYHYYGHHDRIGHEAIRWGPEALEGFASFKERRSPSWVPEDLRADGRL